MGRYFCPPCGSAFDADAKLPADAHEDDNSCNAADLHPTLQSPFRDTLTIENPHDVDWIRFHYTAAGLSNALFRMHAFPGTHPDSLKDLDLYVIKVPAAGDTVLQVMLADTAAGSDVNRTVSLATGDYYLAIVDFAGTTTTYETCVGVAPFLGTPDCSNCCSRVSLSMRAKSSAPVLAIGGGKLAVMIGSLMLLLCHEAGQRHSTRQKSISFHRIVSLAKSLAV